MQRLKETVKKFILGYNYFTPSWSQAGEDMILRNLLRKIDKGFYVDVGAHHPLSGSNTHYFYHFLKWRGINIEPNPERLDLFNALRPEDINLNIGISRERQEMDYFMLKDAPGMNSFSREFIETQSRSGDIEKVLKIQTLPLREVLDRHMKPGREVDLMNIDAEGLDLQVLQSNDWKRYRAKALVVEMGIERPEESEIYGYLRDLDYIMVGMTPVNTQVVMSAVFFDNRLYPTYSNY